MKSLLIGLIAIISSLSSVSVSAQDGGGVMSSNLGKYVQELKEREQQKEAQQKEAQKNKEDKDQGDDSDDEDDDDSSGDEDME